MSSWFDYSHFTSCQTTTNLPIVLKKGINMSRIEKQIGSKIREIRLSSQMTQADLAERIDVSVESISRLERGVTFPSLKTMEKMATALNVPLKMFFEFGEAKAGSKSFETSLSKLVAFLRTLNKDEIILVHKVLKAVFGTIKRSD